MVTAAAAKLTTSTPSDAAYTRFELTDFADGAGRTQTFSIYDDLQYAVTVITSLHEPRHYVRTQVDTVTRTEAREIWARARKAGLAPAKPFRQARFGPVPSKN